MFAITRKSLSLESLRPYGGAQRYGVNVVGSELWVWSDALFDVATFSCNWRDSKEDRCSRVVYTNEGSGEVSYMLMDMTIREFIAELASDSLLREAVLLLCQVLWPLRWFPWLCARL